MGKIGNWGKTIAFEVSSNKTLTFNNFKRTVSARWHTHNIVNGKPKSEFAGPDSSSVTLEAVLAAERGVRPRATLEKLEKACTLIRNGAKFYSTHPDFNCPTETGFIPDSGAICALITASTGKQPRYFGKPHKETAEMLSRRFGIPAEKTAVVGDRLYTDIALGRNNGLTSILVLTGETKREDVNESNAPDFIFDSIGEISRFF